MSPEDQASVAAARLAAVLDYRITMALSGTPARAQQTEQEPSPRPDAQQPDPAAATSTPQPRLRGKHLRKCSNRLLLTCPNQP